MGAVVEVGQAAPEFALPDSDGGETRLTALRGQWVVLYFYPKDNTSGCTTEACDFRDNMSQLASLGVRVVGVSRDSLVSHERFIAKYALNFVLLSDPDGAVHDLYGAWGEKKLYGKVSQGVIRSTFLIDPAGQVRRLWRNVKVKGHVAAVLAALEAARAEG